MADNQFPYMYGRQGTTTNYGQNFFPQPQGNLYLIDSSLEVANVPMSGTGISSAICLPEMVMYLKALQNGTPLFMAYKITPYDKEKAPANQEANQKPQNQQEQLIQVIQNMSERMKSLEEQLEQLKKGGKIDDLI